MREHVEIAELPNIDDSTTKEIGLVVQKMRSCVLTSVNVLLTQNAQASNAAPMIVVTGVFHRMAECTLSIELLASKGFVRDAATLLLTLIELRLDLQYMTLRHGREDEWLKHAAENRKPWPVGQQITELCSDVGERDAEHTNYRNLSMIKHGNPAGGVQSFPIGVREGALVVAGSGPNTDLLSVYLSMAGGNLYQASVAAGQLVHPPGFNIRREIEEIAELDAKLSKLNENHVRQMLLSYAQGEVGHGSSE